VSCQVERFQGTTGVHQTPRKPGCYADHLTLSPGDPIPGSLCCVSARTPMTPDPATQPMKATPRDPNATDALATRFRADHNPYEGRAAKQLAVPLREIVKQEREPSLGPPSSSPGSFALPLSALHFFSNVENLFPPSLSRAREHGKKKTRPKVKRKHATTPVPAQEY